MSSDVSHRSRIPAGVRQGGEFATEPRAESAVSLQDDIPRHLGELLAPYGLAVADVPPDAAGVTLAEHWRRTVEAAAGPDVESVTAAMDRLLDHPDYGRHRGGPDPVWWSPSLADDGWEDAQPATDPDDPRWDDPEVVLAAGVETRMGGGNRDDWAGTIDELQHHAAYLGDVDDSGDETYASFWFRVDDKATVRDALRRKADCDRQTVARKLLADITTGKAAPWQVMPADPKAQAAAEAARAELEAMGRSDLPHERAKPLGIPTRYVPGFGRTQPEVRVLLTEEHLADVDQAIADLEAGARSTDARAQWDWNSPVKRSAGVGQQYAEALARVEERTAARQALDRGEVSAPVAAVLTQAIDAHPYSNAEQRLASQAALRDRHLNALHAARAELKPAVERLRLRRRLEAASRISASDLSWPGLPGTAPARDGDLET